MSISSAFNNALTGLNTSARMAEVVSSNVANALTEGYGRRSVDLSSVELGGRGAGVRVDGIHRHVNDVALADRRLASSDLGNRERTAAALDQLEVAFGLPDDPTSLSGRLAALEQSLISAASDPASDQRLGLVATRLDQLTHGMRDTSANIQSIRQDADGDIANDIEILNRSLQSIEKLNSDIVKTNLSGGDPSGLLDARQVVLDQVSSIVPIRLMSRDNGAVAVMTTSGEVMLDGPAAEYAFEQTPTIVADMSFVGGVLGGVTRNGILLNAGNGFGKLGGGSLEASFRMRDEALPDAQQSLDELAADLITRLEDPAIDPTLTAGVAGLLTDAGNAYTAVDLEGLSSRIAVNSAIDPAAGGAISKLRDGIAATATGPVGNEQQLARWSQALQNSSTIASDIPSLSASGQIGRVSSQLAGLNLVADQELAFASARWDTLNTSVLADGVDTDFEMQMLLQIEQSYSANAKLIQTADRMLQTLMEI